MAQNAVISFDRLINFKQWFDRTNQLGASVGDTTAINTDLGSNLVNAINVVHNDLGDKSALATNVNTNLVEGMNDLRNDIAVFV